MYIIIMKVLFPCIISLLMTVVITARLSDKNDDVNLEGTYHQQDGYSNIHYADDMALINKELNFEEEVEHYHDLYYQQRAFTPSKTTTSTIRTKILKDSTSIVDFGGGGRRDLKSKTTKKGKSTKNDVGDDNDDDGGNDPLNLNSNPTSVEELMLLAKPIFHFDDNSKDYCFPDDWRQKDTVSEVMAVLPQTKHVCGVLTGLLLFLLYFQH
jgi:hypothetical protein